MLTDFDKAVLNLIQAGLPIAVRPFRVLADLLDSDEKTVIERLNCLRKQGYIRRIGPFFDSEKLGYTGTLAAVRVQADKLAEVAEKINCFEEVTHNYEREGQFNLWFTLLAIDKQRVAEILEYIRGLDGVEQIIDLPATRKFKVSVQFTLE